MKKFTVIEAQTFATYKESNDFVVGALLHNTKLYKGITKENKDGTFTGRLYVKA